MAEQNNTKDARKKFDQEDEFQILPKDLLATSEGMILVQAKFLKETLVRFHDHKLAAHQGIEIDYIVEIRGKYFLPKLAKDVWIHIINCLICTKRNVSGKCKILLQPFFIAEYIWQLMTLDIFGPRYL
jgi:hypothetical protein